MVRKDCEALVRRDLELLKRTHDKVRDLLLQGKVRQAAPVLREAKVHINHLEQWVRILGSVDDQK